VLRSGLPFSRFDVLVLAGANIAGSAELAPMLRNLLAAAVPACDGTVVTIENSSLALQGFVPTPPTRLRHLPADPGQVFAVLLNAMRAAEARHAITPPPRTASGGVGLPLTASKSAAV
jgi:hypothetical protein